MECCGELIADHAVCVSEAELIGEYGLVAWTDVHTRTGFVSISMLEVENSSMCQAQIANVSHGSVSIELVGVRYCVPTKIIDCIVGHRISKFLAYILCRARKPLPSRGSC